MTFCSKLKRRRDNFRLWKYFYVHHVQVDHEGLQHYSNKNQWLQKFSLPKEPWVESQCCLEEGCVSVFVCKAGGGGGREDCSAGLHNLFLISTPSTINCAIEILTSCCTLLPFLYSLDYQVRHETSVHTLGLAVFNVLRGTWQTAFSVQLVISLFIIPVFPTRIRPGF